MEPPNGFKYRPLESKVKKRGPILIGNLLEIDLNPSGSIDQCSSNFSIGSGRVVDNKMLDESNLSGVDIKPEDAEIRNLKMKQKFFPPELSIGAANRKTANFESKELKVMAKDQNFKETNYCFNCDIDIASNSDFDGSFCSVKSSEIAPKGWIKDNQKRDEESQLGNSTKQQEDEVKNSYKSYFYSNKTKINDENFVDENLLNEEPTDDFSNYFLNDMYGARNFPPDSNTHMEFIPNDSNFLDYSNFQEDKSEFCTGMIMRDYNRSQITPPSIINSNNDQNSNMNNGFSGNDDTPNSNESRARPHRQAKTKVDYRQLHTKGKTASGSATNTPRPKRVRSENQKVTLEKSAEVMTSGINPADVNLDLDVSSSPEMERNEDAGNERNSITGLTIADGSFIEDNTN